MLHKDYKKCTTYLQYKNKKCKIKLLSVFWIKGAWNEYLAKILASKFLGI